MITNLLTDERKKKYSKDLRSRFFSALSRSVFLVSVFSIVMLFPAYILARSKTEEYKAKPYEESSVDIADASVLERPEDIKSKLSFFRLLEGNINFNSLVESVVSSKNDRVSITGFSYDIESRREGFSGVILSVSGIATNRQALIDFQKKLESTKKFEKVELPVSSLARESNLPFTIYLLIKQ